MLKPLLLSYLQWSKLRVAATSVLPSAALKRPETSHVQRHLDVLRNGGGHLGHGRLSPGLLVGRLRQRAPPQRTELLDVRGALLHTRRNWCRTGAFYDGSLGRSRLLVELKAFEVWEIFAGSPISVKVWALQCLALLAQSRVLAIVGARERLVVVVGRQPPERVAPEMSEMGSWSRLGSLVAPIPVRTR